MNFVERILDFFRKIQVHIVTIFFFLIGVSCLFIIYFNYYRNYEAIHDLSTDVIQEVGDDLIDNISNVLGQAQLLSEVTRGVVGQGGLISDIPTLIPYLLNTLKASPMVFSVGIATEDGHFLAVINLALANLFHYYSRPSEALPKGCKYAVRIVDNTSAATTENWQYFGTDGSILATEAIEPSSYDPRTDPWFTSMKEWPSLHWENSYLPRGINKYYSVEEAGVTVSTPMFNSEGKFFGMIGVNITLNYLSNYITHQQIGKSGKAFVLDSKGNLLIPTQKNLDPSSLVLAKTLVPSTFEQFVKDEQQHFFFREGAVEYIVYAQNFPISLENEWMIVIAVPFSDFFGAIVRTEQETILISLAILILFCALVYLFSKRISVPIVALANEVDRIRHFDFKRVFSIKSNIREIKTLDTSIAAMRTALQSFGKYVPQDVVKTLIEKNELIILGGKKQILPVMFSDITDFTATSEKLTSEEIMSKLSIYFDVISKIILESQGTIDKYIGDSVMAFWGAPREVKDPVKAACLAALRANKVCNIEFKERGLPDWKTRFGIHMGEVIVGNIGTNERMNYTVIGDVVNTTSRLTALNKQYKTSIIISEIVKQNIGKEFITRPLDHVAIKGKQTKITIYELVGTVDELST